MHFQILSLLMIKDTSITLFINHSDTEFVFEVIKEFKRNVVYGAGIISLLPTSLQGFI